MTWLILALGIGTFAFRYLPLTVLSRLSLPRYLREWLSLVPGAVLAALLVQAVLTRDGALRLSWNNPSLLAALPSVLVAWRTRNVLATMVIGMLAYAVISRFV